MRSLKRAYNSISIEDTGIGGQLMIGNIEDLNPTQGRQSIHTTWVVDFDK